MKVLRGLLLLALLIFGAAPIGATSRKHEKAEQATFVLYGRSAERQMDHRELCTAFVYKKVPDGYLLLTAGHCFTPEAPSDATYLVAQGQIVDNPDLQPVEVLNHVDNGVMDVAEIHLKTKKKYPVLELDNHQTQIDDKVFYVGYPEMVSQVVYTGRIGSNELQTLGPDKMDPCDICKGRILVQTGGGPGASGSPLISESTGKVVGVLEGHVFENGVLMVPVPMIEAYYDKVGHSQAELKNVSSGEKFR
jgi:hypothetical protein